MKGGSITTTARDSQGIWAAHQGETGKLTIDVRDAPIRTTGVGDIVVNFRSGAIRTIGVTGRGLQIEQGENADADDGPHTDGGWPATHGAGSIMATVGSEAQIETPFSAGVAGLSAWAARWSGSTFGEGTQAADDAARTAPIMTTPGR